MQKQLESGKQLENVEIDTRSVFSHFMLNESSHFTNSCRTTSRSSWIYGENQLLSLLSNFIFDILLLIYFFTFDIFISFSFSSIFLSTNYVMHELHMHEFFKCDLSCPSWLLNPSNNCWPRRCSMDIIGGEIHYFGFAADLKAYVIWWIAQSFLTHARSLVIYLWGWSFLMQQ